jgi:uncharacterized protein (TIGR02118 family)
MAKLIVLYGHPKDPAAFEDYYANRHLPFASGHMPNVTGAESALIAGTPDGAEPRYYRISEMTYDTLADLRAGISSPDGRRVLADLDNFASGGATVLFTQD